MQKEAMLNLRWDFFSSHLSSTLDMCYEQQYFVDTTLVCKGGAVLKCHKMILAGASTLFQRLLVKNDHPHPMIILHDIEADDLKTIINFIYCGEIEVVKSEVRRLLKIAEVLEISGLKDIRPSGRLEKDSTSSSVVSSTPPTTTPVVDDNHQSSDVKIQEDTAVIVVPSPKIKHTPSMKIKSNYNLRQRIVANKENNIEKNEGSSKKNDNSGRSTSNEASSSSKTVISSHNDTSSRPTTKNRKKIINDDKQPIQRQNTVEDCEYLKKLRLLNEVEVICKPYGDNGLLMDDTKSPGERSLLDCGMFIKEEVDISSDEEVLPRLPSLKRIGRRKRILYPGVEIFRVSSKATRHSLPSTSRAPSTS